MSFAVASTASLRAPVAVRGDAASARRRTRVTASLSPSHPAERASIVKTVVDRIAGASLAIAATVAIATSPASAIQMGLPEEEVTKLICDAACETTINDAELVTTQSGLQYRDIKVGDGVQPEIGFQVVVDYIAKNEQGLIFDNSLEKGKPNDIRITGLGPGGDTNVIPGLDEGILTMRSGGIRRLYIPGELAFPKGLASAPGRPRISAFSPVVFDVKLLYIPGLE
mmetsp:Transcript_350/g.1618  ORF Transcript_350/g.1618 Transcript_350/m.1618 type:complete len:226 (+) Transcript_350:134-811(+)